ncbi:hypothetical protein BGX24_008886 [Mortierella sp. AD032]|nr:hypothetical protein BGX24_008886 [Mortierella sp. AD032]
MPFYGLPLEILQHIASFLPFHGLVRLYTCLPKIHRPIFQLLLDHSLALMMLTLEIRQQSDEQPPTRNSIFVSVNNNPNGIGAVRKLQTHWRVTDFDLDHMRVEFQLEEKLGLEMAERRRREIEYQIQQNRKKSHDPLAEAREQLERSRHGQEDFENLIWRSRTGGMSSSSSTSSLIGSLQQSSSSSLSSSPSTPEVEVSDSNFFHCNGSSHTPTLGSATVSFKAQRNMPAPWIAQNFDFADPATPSPPSSASTSSSASVAPESPGVVRARERVAAYRQNRLLLRALAKMRCREESSRLQFLPVTVELETEELGQKKVEAELVEPNNNSSNTYSGDVHRHQSGHGKTFPATTAGSSSSTIKLGRRHSWQTLRYTDRPGTVDWSSVFQSVASSMHRSSSSSSHTSTTPTATATTAAVATACQCPHRKAVLLTTSKQQDPSTAAAASAANAAKSSVAVAKRRSFSNMVTGYRKGKTSSSSAPDSSQHDASLVAASGVVDKGKGKGKGKATQSTLQEQQLRREKEREEQHQKLFEFSYGVRHNYLHSHRLEGERVIRPMRFACSLDFFIQK